MCGVAITWPKFVPCLPRTLHLPRPFSHVKNKLKDSPSKNKAEQTIKQLLPSHLLHNTTKPVNMSDSDDSMGSASEYEYHSQSEDEEDSYSTGEAKKCSPQASKGLPYFLLSASDCELRKNEVKSASFPHVVRPELTECFFFKCLPFVEIISYAKACFST